MKFRKTLLPVVAPIFCYVLFDPEELFSSRRWLMLRRGKKCTLESARVSKGGDEKFPIKRAHSTSNYSKNRRSKIVVPSRGKIRSLTLE